MNVMEYSTNHVQNGQRKQLQQMPAVTSNSSLHSQGVMVTFAPLTRAPSE